ncbi:isoamylase early set domain-containing protein [Atribacter laminatus]|uniref:1,4-alpha-glucan branching enzyme GlgB n=1 Tax=Atribacter laminatus TaxID=2847778 RepID=A0A7T1ALD1_ATRLM|nr:isoamylase early set domain-containing protein [Atribacter laminatus]QPM68058.1 1,4-alpha-glucan branching enzyme GlgB [Atribacter laminatus]
MSQNREKWVKEIFRQTVIKAVEKGEEIQDKIQKLTEEIINSEIKNLGLTQEKMKNLTQNAMEGIIEGTKETREKAEELNQKAIEGIIAAIRNLPGLNKTKTREYIKHAASGIKATLNNAGDKIVDSLYGTLENIFELKQKARVTFKFMAPNASQVSLVGSFNDWNPTATPLKKTLKGHWSVTLSLLQGKYEYRYLVDNQWFTDPNTPHVFNQFGTENSILTVGE